MNLLLEKYKSILKDYEELFVDKDKKELTQFGVIFYTFFSISLFKYIFNGGNKN